MIKQSNIYSGVGINKNYIFHNFKFHVCLRSSRESKCYKYFLKILIYIYTYIYIYNIYICMYIVLPLSLLLFCVSAPLFPL